MAVEAHLRQQAILLRMQLAGDPELIDLQEPALAPTLYYADGGAVDRTMCSSWRAWRPGRKALVHLVSNRPYGEYGSRDGLDDPSDLLGVVRTPRAKANFFSLRDFEAQVDRAEEQAQEALAERIAWQPATA